MKLLSKSNFLYKYKNSPADSLDFNEFLNSAIVVDQKKNEKLLKNYKKDNIDIDSLKILFEEIKNRNEYLTRFYNTSLLVNEDNLHFSGKTPMNKADLNNNEEVQYKNLIRNLHYLDILQKTKSGFENTPSYLQIINDLYKKNRIDYKLLTPSALFYIKNGRLGSVFSSFYFRASILNPYLIYSLNEKVLKGTKIFTPTLGWSSYLFGFFESNLTEEYVGTDVIKNVCDKTKVLGEQYSKKTTIYCKPSEDLLKDDTFLSKYKNYFDVVFFSPPYYKLELYDGDKQSTNRYSDYQDWLTGYWENTIKLCHKVLQNNGKLCYILSGYGSHENNTYLDLVKDMNVITEMYFQKKEVLKMENKNVHSTKHRFTGEKIMIYVK